jgi:hypothetical protein
MKILYNPKTTDLLYFYDGDYYGFGSLLTHGYPAEPEMLDRCLPHPNHLMVDVDLTEYKEITSEEVLTLQGLL